jgi:hypothetical protein
VLTGVRRLVEAVRAERSGSRNANAEQTTCAVHARDAHAVARRNAVASLR